MKIKDILINYNKYIMLFLNKKPSNDIFFVKDWEKKIHDTH